MDGLGTKYLVPDYITAGSPRGLRLKMFQTNAKFKGMAKYFDIGQTKDGKWIAWFYRELETFEKLESPEQEAEV